MTETAAPPVKITSQHHVENPRMSFAKDVLTGLNKENKRLSSVYFYDERGSKLFEEICDLDEYYLTRSETEILQNHAIDIVSKLPYNCHLVELGSGSSRKTRILLENALARFSKTQYSPIDISSEILTETAKDLNQRYPELEIEAVAGRYEFGLEHLLKRGSDSSCIMWLGSSMGNLTRAESASFLRDIHQYIGKEDSLLLGIDLRKEAHILEPAYDDARKVTADFNLNLLDRINSELGGNFVREQFHHKAVYNVEEGRIEMYLVSDQDQSVSIENLGSTISFRKNEEILTEYSYKYSNTEINALADASGFYLDQQWLDKAGWFSLNLLKPQSNAPEMRAQ